jgi:hypothetical protein
MSSDRELLGLRRDVLAARSSMLRLRAAGELQAVRESLTLHEMAGSLATSAKARSALFGALLILAGTPRVARIVRIAAVAVAVAKAVTLVRKLVRQPEPTSAASSRSPAATP